MKLIHEDTSGRIAFYHYSAFSGRMKGMKHCILAIGNEKLLPKGEQFL